MDRRMKDALDHWLTTPPEDKCICSGMQSMPEEIDERPDCPIHGIEHEEKFQTTDFKGWWEIVPDADNAGYEPLIDVPKDTTVSGEATARPLYIGGLTIDDLIRIHLENCDQCRTVSDRSGPVRLGEKSKHCDDYWHMQILKANYEGKVNNVVAHTELGDEAPKQGQLE